MKNIDLISELINLIRLTEGFKQESLFKLTEEVLIRRFDQHLINIHEVISSWDVFRGFLLFIVCFLKVVIYFCF